MIVLLYDTLEQLRRLHLVGVVTLSLALLGLPCGPVGEALASNVGQAVTTASDTLSAHGDPDSAHHANKHENNCCTDCSIWLTALTEDGAPAVIGASKSSPSGLLQIALVGAPSLNDWSARAYQFTRSPSVTFADTSLYSKTQRYRI